MSGQGVVDRVGLRALLLDLDGTLIHIDKDAFLADYVAELSSHFTRFMPAEEFARLLLESTDAMCMNLDPALTNKEVFYKDFFSKAGHPRDQFDPIFDHFYDVHFPELRRHARAKPEARALLQWASEAGLKIVVATNPVFPRKAVFERMAWGNIHDLYYDLVTTYEIMHFCKPHPQYYLEICSLVGTAPEECLMAGNDVDEDMAASAVGMSTFLVTDSLINRSNAAASKFASGSLADLLDVARSGGLSRLFEQQRRVSG